MVIFNISYWPGVTQVLTKPRHPTLSFQGRGFCVKPVTKSIVPFSTGFRHPKTPIRGKRHKEE